MAEDRSSSACGGMGFVPVSTVTRAGGNNCPNCASNHGYAACASAAPPYSTYELDERRKVEILKYKKNGAQLSRAQQYSMAARNALTRKKAWATQTQTYTNPNTNNLPETQIVIDDELSTVSLQCGQSESCSLTSDCDVPGAVIPLCINNEIPLYNYRTDTTYASGGKGNLFRPVPPVFTSTVIAYTTLTLVADTTIAALYPVTQSITFIIPSGITLTVANGGTITIYGTFTNHGTLIIHGTVNNYGTFTNHGTLTNVRLGVIENKTGGTFANSGTFNNSGTFLGSFVGNPPIVPPHA